MAVTTTATRTIRMRPPRAHVLASAAVALVSCCGFNSSGGSVLALALPHVGAAATTAVGTATSSTKVLVTGASGRTGQLVFAALLRDTRFEPTALVRSERSAKKLRKAVPGTGLDQIVICDVAKDLPDWSPASSPTATDTARDAPPAPVVEGLVGLQAMVICTSAVPVISKVSLLKAFLKAPFNLLAGKKAVDFRTLKFGWRNRQYPELVDYRGQVAQINLAQRLDMDHVVVVGSMGGTDPTNFLNAVGKNPDGSGHGDILLWKRRGERHLVESGLGYTILHPGGLVDAAPGETAEDYVLDVNDRLMTAVTATQQPQKRSISRDDVARLCVAALALAAGHGHNGGRDQRVAFDCVTVPRAAQETVPTAEAALADFLTRAPAYDYAL